MVENKAIEELVGEHKLIDEMVDLLDLSVAKARDTPLPDSVISKELEFCKNFINKCHEAKEEQLIATELARHGYPLDRGPILQMLEDHRKGRAILRRLMSVERISKPEERQQSFMKFASAYSLYLYEHIREEETHVFKAADITMKPEEQIEIARKSEEMDRELLGDDSRDKYTRILGDIRKTLG